MILGVIVSACQSTSGAVLLGSQLKDSGSLFDPAVLAGIALLLVAAKLGGEIFLRLKQPAVLGELVSGLLLGNLVLVGFQKFETLKSDHIIESLAQIGIILLLFEIGVETNLADMRKVGWSAFLVAVVGVIVPFFLGWSVCAYFLPAESRLGHIFVASILCATSVGITARTFKDLGRLSSRESRIVLGAAVIDDVIGLLILAVLISAAESQTSGIGVSIPAVAWTCTKALVFLFGSYLLGRKVVPRVFHAVGAVATGRMLLAVSIAFCFFSAWLATLVSLAPIVGAFAAGLMIEEVHFKPFKARGDADLLLQLSPLTTVFVPVFFVLMGMKVDLKTFAGTETIGLAIALTLAAILGKQICGLVPLDRGLNRLAIGLGMIPRGEVGLIVASIGATIVLTNPQGVANPAIGPRTFAAIVVMVFVTTILTPPVLKWALERKNR